MNITEAVLQFKTRNPKATKAEILAFIKGWTAHEVTIEVGKLLTIKVN